MPEPYFRVQAALGDNTVELGEDPLRPGELLLTADAGTKVRVRLDEAKSARLASALMGWYASDPNGQWPVSDTSHLSAGEGPARDTVTQYRDGQVYSFTTPTEV